MEDAHIIGALWSFLGTLFGGFFALLGYDARTRRKGLILFCISLPFLVWLA